nr:dockerin type I repeat-containing protein [Parabacteroides goldsteinii]
MKQTKFNLTAATLCLLPVFFIQSVSGGTGAGAPLEVVQILSTGSENTTPTNFDLQEVEALKAIATANPGSTDLQEFIAQEGWKENREAATQEYRVGVKWDTQSPAHVETLFIVGQYDALTELDLSAFKYLKSLDVNYDRALSELDLSQQTNLKSLIVNMTTLTYSKVKLAENIELIKSDSHSTMKGLGTPVDDHTSIVAIGTEIDLSSEATINGIATTYQWYKMFDNESRPVESVNSTETGKFILEGKPGEIYSCHMTNSAFPGWSLSTDEIKISRSCTYNEQDINGLKKLAEDNPKFTKLQEFVDTKGWELENWGSYQDEIKTDWKVENNVARLTHLYIQPNWGQDMDTYLEKMDVSAFSELQHLQCERYNQIASLDLSKNTKLEVLRIYTEKMVALDVSYCLELKELTFRNEDTWQFDNSKNILSTLNFDGCTNLTKLQIIGSPLTSIDITKTPLLETLFIENCEKLQIVGDVNNLEYLWELGLNYTTQFEKYAKNPPSSVIHLYLMGTDYPLPDDEVLGGLGKLELPKSATSFNLNKIPNLNYLELWKSQVRFSTLERRNNDAKLIYHGESYYVLPGYSQSNIPVYKKGDRIDLSSEADIDGYKTTYMWVNRDFNIEDTETFIEDPEHPGVFVVNQDVEKGYYTCMMANPLYTSSNTINSWGGWRVLFNCRLEGEATQDNFSESDVATLKKIVDASSSDLLKSWWNEGAWKKNDVYESQVSAEWNNENPRRLIGLTLGAFHEELTAELDLSALDALETFVCASCAVKKVTLPKNPMNLTYLSLRGNPLETLIVSPYVNLETLGIQYTGLKNLDLSNNHKLKNLSCNGTDLALIEDFSNFPNLEIYGVPTGQKTLDLQKIPSLLRFIPDESKLKFSDIKNPRQITDMGSFTNIVVGDIGNKATAYGAKMDCSTEMNIGGTASQINWYRTPVGGEAIKLEGGTDGIYQINDQFNPGDKLTAYITNSLFSRWELIMETTIYSCAGDANLDKTVNVQDITASISEILKDTENKVTPFGDLEADVNGDGVLNVSDVVGIVGIIQNKPVVTKNTLRSEYEPVIRLSKDEKGFLYMEAPVAVAGIQLTFTGVKGTIPLLGEAARFVQASVEGDTLRMLAYSTDGTTLPSGKSVLMQLPKGARLVDAVFSDVNARSLKSEGEDIATSSEIIRPEATVTSIRNYPNPFRSTTTFLYTLEEDAQEAMIQIFSANGALAKTLSGLPAVAGQNSYPCTLSLPAGVYYYRLSTKNAGVVKISKSNLFIIK